MKISAADADIQVFQVYAGNIGNNGYAVSFVEDVERRLHHIRRLCHLHWPSARLPASAGSDMIFLFAREIADSDISTNAGAPASPAIVADRLFTAKILQPLSESFQ